VVEYQPDHLQLLLQKSAPSSSVVNELLAEWTTLTEDEIEDVTLEQTVEDEGAQENTRTNDQEMTQEPIRFKDALGRKFAPPFHLAKTWRVSTQVSTHKTDVQALFPANFL
jgi:hypothetical protein